MQEDIERHAGLSGFYILANGLDAFAARALLADSAERSIDAQYYLLHNDLVGRLFLHSLLKAADRGVRVRLLVDDMTLDDDKDLGMAALDAHDRVEIRVFNPFTRKSYRWLQILTRFDDVTRRMHNKSFTVETLRIEDHTIMNVPERMDRLGTDPLADVLDDEPDLLGALARLTGRFS